ncbi:MAG: hypothetical protein CMJ49_02910 [Planctomycetaceae bacterium]|nr:hypothetical protein [Planctomycetaceae bacterium]
MGTLENVKGWLRQITEIALLLVALAIVLEIIFGVGVFTFGDGGGTSIVANLTATIKGLGSEGGFIGLIALGLIVWLFTKKQQQIQHG